MSYKPKTYKKPSYDALREALAKAHGNLTNTAAILGINRVSLWIYARDDEEFDRIIKDSRKKKLDNFISTAEVLALGIPDIDPVTKKVVGWVEKPDGQMLRYFMSTLGRDEGFGDSLDVTSKGEKINNAVQVEIIDKRSDVIKENE